MAGRKIKVALETTSGVTDSVACFVNGVFVFSKPAPKAYRNIVVDSPSVTVLFRARGVNGTKLKGTVTEGAVKTEVLLAIEAGKGEGTVNV